MKGNFRDTFILVTITTGIALSAAPAHADPVLEARCAADSLDPTTARLRLEWARACGTRINLQSPTNPTPPAI